MKTFEERFDALPKWAKQHIRSLDKTIEELNQALAIHKEESTGSGKVKLIKNDEIKNINLPDDITIEFDLPENQSAIHFQWCEDNQYGQHVRVYASGSLKVLPQAANSVYLKGYWTC